MAPGSNKELPPTALSSLTSALRSLYGPRLLKLVLYGSEARKDSTPESDIDVLVVLAGPVRPAEEVHRCGPIATSLSLQNGRLISLAFVSEDRFLSEQSPFLMNVRSEGVAV